jgi:DNA repair exonuclease SbcCD ATPase subunit
MKAIHSNSVRFLKLHLHNYGIFRGSHDFVFDPQRTIIIGEGGTGKTTIINALKYLGQAPGAMPYLASECDDMSVKVITSGNRDLIKKFHNIIFLNCKSSQQLARKQEKIVADKKA